MQIKIQALEKGLEVAKKKLQEIENENKNLENSNKGLEGSWIAVAAVATGALAGIISSIKSATEEYKAHEQAMASLQDVSKYTGENMNELSEIMDKYSNIMTKSDLATTIKNFTLMGMKAKDTEKMIEALTNSAIRNRNANYTVSEAVRVASEGYRQGLSTLSDSAGVTENLSVMLDNYAKSIGKTASQLTEAEKNQAYLNRTMYAAEPFAGAMEDYLDSLAGKQGEYSQSMRDTKVAFAEAMEPVLSKLLELGTNVLNILNGLISANPSLTAGIVTMITTLLGLVTAVTAIKKAYDVYKTSAFAATVATKGFTAALAANPVGATVLGLSVLAGAVTTVTTALQEQKVAQEELREAQELHNQVMRDTIDLNDETLSSMQSRADAIQDYLDMFKEWNDIDSSLNYLEVGIDTSGINTEQLEQLKNAEEELRTEGMLLGVELNKQSDEFKKLFGITKEGILNYEDLSEILNVYNKRIEEVNSIQKVKSATDLGTIKTQQKEAAQLKINADQMQSYLNVVKKGDKSTTEYQNAVTALTKAYPEAANAEGIIINQAQNFIDAEKLKADQAWNTSQTTIQGNIAVINSFIELATAAENDVAKQQQLAQAIGISYSEIIPTLNSVLNALQLIGGYSPTQVPNVTPTSVSTPKRSGGGSSSYSNKRLDNYKKEIEHKKAMDQISLKEEIAMYEKALRSYAKTTDEKRELREKIYELNKELAKKEKDLLDQQTEDYETYIEKQKNLRGAAYDINEQTSDYNKIIQMHKNYLNQIMKDERLSLDERKEIYREELQTIREYEQQKRDLRVEQIDNTVSQLTNAITKQLEDMQKKEKDIIDQNLKVIEEWKNARIDAINEEYDARIEAINKELEALNKAEQQKTRDEEDAEFERKRKRLEDLVAFEHDATTRANYQKELDKLITDHQKTLDLRALQDKKDALNEQKELLQEEQDAMVDSVEKEAERQTEIYNNQLEELEKYYEEQIDMAQETAEKMLLNVGKNQDKIISLLQNYGDKYEITGQTLGEKLAQGINEGLTSRIENIISKIQDKIDAGIEAQIAKISSSAYKYEAGAGKSTPQSITTNVVQNNYIEQNPELPSETYRKLNNVSQNLAAEIAGM